VVAVDDDGQFYAWPLLAPVRGNERLDEAISISPEGLLVAGETVQNGVEVRDLTTGRTLRRFTSSQSSHATVFSRDGRRLYVGGNYGRLAAYDLGKGACAWTLRAHDVETSQISVATDGTLVATGGKDGKARVWDAHTGELLRTLSGLGGIYVSGIAFAPKTEGAPGPGTPPAADIPSVLRDKRLFVASEEAGLVVDWDLDRDAEPRRMTVPGKVKGMNLSADGKTLAICTNRHFIAFRDAASLRDLGNIGPLASMIDAYYPIDPGDGHGQWGLSQGTSDVPIWDLATGEPQILLAQRVGFGRRQCMATTPDGKTVYAAHNGRINLMLPRLYRELQSNPSALVRAQWYAEWGAWAWVRELLVREQTAGHRVPSLLLARAHWMCGDMAGARREFDAAVALREVPAWYADLCLSVDETPLTVADQAPASRPPDPPRWKAVASDLPPGVLSAADLPALKAALGKDIVAEGFVRESLWSKKGKHLTIKFAGKSEQEVGLVCVVSHKDREAFDDAFDDDAAAAFSGARLRVRGKLVPYDGKVAELKGWPQIDLDDPKQVTIVK